MVKQLLKKNYRTCGELLRDLRRELIVWLTNNSKLLKPAHHQHESGIILIWIMMLTFLGMIFVLTMLQIGIMYYNKIKLNNDAIMISMFGALSANQPGPETLNRMAAMARTIEGFELAQAVQGTQNLAGGRLTLVHNTDLIGGNNTTEVIITKTYGPADSMLAHLGSTVVTGHAKARPDNPLITLAVDMSTSLVGPAVAPDNLAAKNIVLKALGMSLDNSGNLQIDSTSPDPLAATNPSVAVRQSLIPGAFNPWRMMRPWKGDTQNYPDLSFLPPPPAPDPNCVSTPELPCNVGGYYDITHSAAASSLMSDLSLQYKYAATTMLSVVSMMSPYLQVLTFGGKQLAADIANANYCIGNPPQGGLSTAVATGVNEIWSYDQEVVTVNSFYDVSTNACNLTVAHPFTYDTPASIFIDDMPMGPNRLYQFNLALTFWYKLWKYADIKDESGTIVIPKGTLSPILTPVMPAAVTTNTGIPWEPPTDSFQYYPGDPLHYDLLAPYTIGYTPIPLTVARGVTARPTNANWSSISSQLAAGVAPTPAWNVNGYMPPSATLLYEFNLGTGRPLHNQPTAANCNQPSNTPVCDPIPNSSTARMRWCNPDGILFCINPQNFGDIKKSNCTFGDGTCGLTSPLYLSENYTGASSGAGSLAASNTHGLFRGNVSFPDSSMPAPEVGASPFYALMFHGLSAGTWTNEAVKAANAKRNQIRLDKADKKHVLIILTDGFPEALQVDPVDGQMKHWWMDAQGDFMPAQFKWQSDSWIMDDLADQVTQFDGQIVTWYLSQGGTPPASFTSLMDDPTNDRRMITSSITATGGAVGVANPTQFINDMTIIAALAQPQIELVE